MKISKDAVEAKTMPEFFEKRYGDRRLKVVSAIVIFAFLIPYSASVYNGLSTLFEIVFGIPGWIVMIALAALTALYLFFGGYFATALSKQYESVLSIISKHKLEKWVHNKTIQKALESNRISKDKKDFLKTLKINFKNRTIEMPSKRYASAASKFGSIEYHEVQQAFR